MSNAEPIPTDSYDGQIEFRLNQLGGEIETAPVPESSILNDPDISLQLTRRAADEFDTLIGFFRCQFESQQQRFALHVPIYPAMNEIPEVEAVVLDCDDAKIRVTDRQKFGLRLEIVLSEPCPAMRKLVVEVTAYSRLM